MLMKKWIFLQKQAFKNCFNSLFTHPVLTIITSLMIGFILTMPTFLWVISLKINSSITSWEKNAYLSFYLNSSASEMAREDIIMRLKETEGVANIKVISPDVSLSRLLSQQDSQAILSGDMKNPLPYVIEVYPKFELIKQDKMMDLYNKIAYLPGLESSRNDLGWFARLMALEKFIQHFSLLLVGLLLLGVTFLVSNTLRMVIHARYDEIQVLKLIGAPQSFILTPFLYAGSFYGLLGAIFAIASVDIIMYLLQDYFRPLANLYNCKETMQFMSLTQVLDVSLLALVLGWGAAWVFVRCYLNSIEPV